MRTTRTTLLMLAIMIANMTFAQEMALLSELALDETSTVSSNQTQAMPTRGEINGHEYVDLGLSVKWATCNVGASSPSDYGDYFAWGETSTKSVYTSSTSKNYGQENLGDIAGNSRYDAARANWGGSWRLPTKAEMEELESSKCKWSSTTQNGVNGYKVTGPNGNSIFLPAAGLRSGSSLSSEGFVGCYWGSTPVGYPNYPCWTFGAYCFGFSNGKITIYDSDWGIGRTVRAVSE